MNKEFWHAKWNSNDIAFNQQQPNFFMMEYFNFLNLKPSSKVFVPLCGKSIDLLWLAEQGYEVIGIELNLQACEDFFTENNISFQQNKIKNFTILSSDKITLISGDFFELNTDIIGQIDAIYDRAALIALPTEMRQLYANKIISLATHNTQILLITLNYDQNTMQGPPFAVNKDAVHHLYDKYFNIKTLYSKSAENIPDHLQAKGLEEATDLVFMLLKEKS